MSSMNTQLQGIYKQQEATTIPWRAAIAMALATVEGIALQEKYLNGFSPHGNPLMDRGFFAQELRELTQSKLKVTIPASIKSAKVASVAMQLMKRAGIPMQRNGRIDVARLEMFK